MLGLDALCGGGVLALVAASIGCYVDGQQWPALYTLLLALLVAVLWDGLARREGNGDISGR